MNESQPTMTPGGTQAAAVVEYDAPSLSPATVAPERDSATALALQSPPAPTAGLELLLRQSAPALPAEAAGDAVGAVTVWQNGKRISALWTIAEDRNAWVGVTGIGWRKLSNASETATTALAMLSAHARDRDRQVNYREEADGMIHEMYVW